ncbi:hypothetical protein [Neptuniibacter halophilus]|uniref:hypothetical protein n=1 Tax=Neptuniibacter halophilus TaxID=651666 RepID=UPI002573D5B9|nr:hypothetical protein [Neptuniibacter halophilus]
MEFVVVFVVSFLVLAGVAVAFALGKPPAYRPERQQIMQLLLDVENKQASTERWELFLSLPIGHDPELEQIRRQCLVIAYGDGDQPAAREGINGALFDQAGMLRLRPVMLQLKKLIDQEPSSTWF